jgi:MFS family permease
VKTPRRNKAVAIVFFVLVALVGGPLLSLWLAQTFDVSDTAIFFISLLWGAIVMLVAIWMYRELEDLRWHREAEAEEARLEQMWSQTMRDNGYRP